MHQPPTSSAAPGGNAGIAVRVLILAVAALLGLGAVLAQQAASKTSAKPGIELKVNPSSRNVNQGEAASYSVAVTSTGGFSGSVSFVVSGLPVNSTGAFSPSSVTLAAGGTASVTMNVTTASDTPAGDFGFTVTGNGGSVRASDSGARLTVKGTQHGFSLTGKVSGLLAPGVTSSVDLLFGNTNNKGLALSALKVSITGVVRTDAAIAAGLPCSAEDYAVSQYSGPYPLNAPVGASSLSGLGIPPGQWPQIKMLDTQLRQDGCKGATLQLAYSGSGQGN